MAHTPQVNQYQHERQITDPQSDLNADVAVFAGVNRLRVEAIIAAGGILDEDVDDDNIAAGQTLLLSIVLNYQFDGTNQRRVQARAANTAIDQALMYTLTRAVLSGVDSGAGAGSEVVAIGSDTVNATSLAGTDQALEVNAKLFANDGGAASHVFADILNSVSGIATNSVRALYAIASITGEDNTGAAVLRPVEARALNTNADETAIGAFVKAAFSGIDGSLAANTQLRTASSGTLNFGSATASTRIGVHVIANMAGIDTTGATTIRQVEARDALSSGDFVRALIGSLVNARNALVDKDANEWGSHIGLSEIDDGNRNVGAGIFPIRASGYWATHQGRRFRWTSAGNNIAGTTSFSATAPQLILVSGATNDHIIRKIRVYLAVAGGATPVNVRLIIDTADRYSSGGTARTPGNTNTASATAAGGDHYVDGAITATAAGGGTREIGGKILENTVGKFVEFEFKDGLVIGVADSLLLYWFSGTSAPECHYEVEFEEINVQ